MLVENDVPTPSPEIKVVEKIVHAPAPPPEVRIVEKIIRLFVPEVVEKVVHAPAPDPVIVEKVVERVVYSSAPSRKFMYTIVFLAALAAQGVVHFLICA